MGIQAALLAYVMDDALPNSKPRLYNVTFCLLYLPLVDFVIKFEG